MKQLTYLFIGILLGIATILQAQDIHESKGKFSGYMIGDYFYNVRRDTTFSSASAPKNAAVTGPQDMQGFQFRRIYFAYDNEISDQFTSRFRLEADQSALTTGVKSSNGDGTFDGKISVFVKDAYLKWKNVFEGTDMIFGIQPTTAYDISEAAWGYRSLEKTIMDLRGIIPSRDFGIALRGKLTSDGIVNYWAMLANGDGNRPAATKFKRYSLTLQVKPDNHWLATLAGDYRAQPGINDPLSTTNPKATVSNNILTGAVFVGYKETDRYAFGIEGFLNSAMNAYTASNGSLTALKKIGVSVWGSVNLQSTLAVVGRYDYFDPNTDGNSASDARNYIIGGVSWKPDNNVSIIPNVQLEMYETPPGGKAPDASVTGRVTFYYVFL